MPTEKLTWEFSTAQTLYKNRTRVAFSKLRIGWRSGSPISHCWNRRKLLMICNPNKKSKYTADVIQNMKRQPHFFIWALLWPWNCSKATEKGMSMYKLMDITIMQYLNIWLIKFEKKQKPLSLGVSAMPPLWPHTSHQKHCTWFCSCK